MPGPVRRSRGATSEEIDVFERDARQVVAPELRSFWKRWGTGTVFETEEFLSPVRDESTGDSAWSLLQESRRRGLPQHFVPFHRGLGGLTVAANDGQIYVVSEDGFPILATYESIDAWFNDSVFNEYSTRYGLP